MRKALLTIAVILALVLIGAIAYNTNTQREDSREPPLHGESATPLNYDEKASKVDDVETLHHKASEDSSATSATAEQSRTDFSFELDATKLLRQRAKNEKIVAKVDVLSSTSTQPWKIPGSSSIGAISSIGNNRFLILTTAPTKYYVFDIPQANLFVAKGLPSNGADLRRISGSDAACFVLGNDGSLHKSVFERFTWPKEGGMAVATFHSTPISLNLRSGQGERSSSEKGRWKAAFFVNTSGAAGSAPSPLKLIAYDTTSEKYSLCELALGSADLITSEYLSDIEALTPALVRAINIDKDTFRNYSPLSRTKVSSNKDTSCVVIVDYVGEAVVASRSDGETVVKRRASFDSTRFGIPVLITSPKTSYKKLGWRNEVSLLQFRRRTLEDKYELFVVPWSQRLIVEKGMSPPQRRVAIPEQLSNACPHILSPPGIFRPMLLSPILASYLMNRSEFSPTFKVNVAEHHHLVPSSHNWPGASSNYLSGCMSDDYAVFMYNRSIIVVNRHTRRIKEWDNSADSMSPGWLVYAEHEDTLAISSPRGKSIYVIPRREQTADIKPLLLPSEEQALTGAHFSPSTYVITSNDESYSLRIFNDGSSSHLPKLTQAGLAGSNQVVTMFRDRESLWCVAGQTLHLANSQGNFNVSRNGGLPWKWQEYSEIAWRGGYSTVLSKPRRDSENNSYIVLRAAPTTEGESPLESIVLKTDSAGGSVCVSKTRFFSITPNGVVTSQSLANPDERINYRLPESLMRLIGNPVSIDHVLEVTTRNQEGVLSNSDVSTEFTIIGHSPIALFAIPVSKALQSYKIIQGKYTGSAIKEAAVCITNKKALVFREDATLELWEW